MNKNFRLEIIRVLLILFNLIFIIINKPNGILYYMPFIMFIITVFIENVTNKILIYLNILSYNSFKKTIYKNAYLLNQNNSKDLEITKESYKLGNLIYIKFIKEYMKNANINKLNIKLFSKLLNNIYGFEKEKKFSIVEMTIILLEKVIDVYELQDNFLLYLKNYLKYFKYDFGIDVANHIKFIFSILIRTIIMVDLKTIIKDDPIAKVIYTNLNLEDYLI